MTCRHAVAASEFVLRIIKVRIGNRRRIANSWPIWSRFVLFCSLVRSLWRPLYDRRLTHTSFHWQRVESVLSTPNWIAGICYGTVWSTHVWSGCQWKGVWVSRLSYSGRHRLRTKLQNKTNSDQIGQLFAILRRFSRRTSKFPKFRRNSKAI